MAWKIRLKLYVNDEGELEIVVNEGFGADVYSLSSKKEANNFLKKYLCFRKRDIKDFWEEEKEAKP